MKDDVVIAWIFEVLSSCAETLDLRLLSDSLVSVFSSSREQLKRKVIKKTTSNHMLFVLII